MATRRSKPIPKRSTKIAEDDAKKMRMEPPKPSRQDVGLEVATPEGWRILGEYDRPPVEPPKYKKYPSGGCFI
jgi:hypothetical protein